MAYAEPFNAFGSSSERTHKGNRNIPLANLDPAHDMPKEYLR